MLNFRNHYYFSIEYTYLQFPQFCNKLCFLLKSKSVDKKDNQLGHHFMYSVIKIMFKHQIFASGRNNITETFVYYLQKEVV